MFCSMKMKNLVSLDPKEVTKVVDSIRGDLLTFLGRMVAVNSHSLNREGVAEVAEIINHALPSPLKLTGLPAPDHETVWVCHHSPAGKKPILLLGHLDTVFPPATFDRSMAFQDAYLLGPGVADMKGFVTFHGGLQTPEGQDYSRAKGKVLVLHGTADANITMDHFAALANELEQHGVAHEMITYSGAPHAFTVFGSDRYREDADKKSWKRVLEFLKETLS